MTLSPWLLLPLAFPVLWLGEWLQAHVQPLARFDLPVPIIGGLLVAGAVLVANLLHCPLSMATQVRAGAWTWLVEPEPLWHARPWIAVYLPLSTAFFTCIGLNASWSIVKRGGWRLIVLLSIATVLGVVQNIVGVSLCRWMNVNPLLGLICGSVTLTGGPSTAMGFAADFEKAGFAGAGVVGAASAMFGIVAASLLAGWVGGQLIRSFRLQSHEPVELCEATNRVRAAFFDRLRSPLLRTRSAALHLIVLLICIKLGAWLGWGIKLIPFPDFHGGSTHLSFPVYIGAMLVGLLLRNVLDLSDAKMFSTSTINAIAAVMLALFLAMAISSLNLLQLRHIAGPMLTVLIANSIVTLVFCAIVTFIVMGRGYDAAVTVAGNIGFSLGITPNAIATMDVLEQKFGPSTEAVLIVTLVGGFLIDLTNSLIITAHMGYLK